MMNVIAIQISLFSLIALGSCKSNDEQSSIEAYDLKQDPQTMNNESKQTTKEMPKSEEVAIIGGGCFWCTEAVFEMIDGVKSVVSGYAGGTSKNPTYKEICTGKSGHAEVIRIVYDPNIISFQKILSIFAECHDPTTLNRQGADVGTQYRLSLIHISEPTRPY